jgi:hypothetical protein
MMRTTLETPPISLVKYCLEANSAESNPLAHRGIVGLRFNRDRGGGSGAESKDLLPSCLLTRPSDKQSQTSAALVL